MLFRYKTYIGLCAILVVSLPALAGEGEKPRGYSTKAPKGTYHSSSSPKQVPKADLLADCDNADHLVGAPKGHVPSRKDKAATASLPSSKQETNKDQTHVPHLKFDIEVPLPRRRNLPPVANVGELSVDLNNGTTRLGVPGQETKSTKCK